MGNQISTNDSTIREDDFERVNETTIVDDITSAYQQLDFPKDEAFVDVAMQQFRLSMASYPKALTRNYYEASQREQSDKLESEVPEILFLMCEDHNPWRASWRCVKYWNQRKKTFGERAYNPMVQSSAQGALQQTDIDLLRSGAISLEVDASSTICWLLSVDVNKVIQYQEHDADAAARCIFYLLTICMENTRMVEDGIKVVVFIDGEHANFISELCNWHQNFLEAFPIRRASIHIISRSSSPPTSTSVASMSQGRVTLDVQIHPYQSDEQLFAALQKLELPNFIVPVRLGGKGIEERADRWHKERLLIEVNKHGVPVASRATLYSEAEGVGSGASESDQQHEVSSTDSRPPSSISVHTSSQSHNGQRTTKPTEGTLNNRPIDRQEFIRKRNAAYSKRKYHRKKIEIEVLKKQTVDLQQQNEKLRIDGQRFEDLLRSAQAQIAIIEADRTVEPSIARNATAHITQYPLGFSADQVQQRISLPQAERGGNWGVSSDSIDQRMHIQKQPQQNSPKIMAPAVFAGSLSPAPAPLLQLPTINNQLSMLTNALPNPVISATSSANIAHTSAAQLAHLYSELLSGRVPVPSQTTDWTHAPTNVNSASLDFNFNLQGAEVPSPPAPQAPQAPSPPDPVTYLLEQLLRARQNNQNP